MHRHIIDAARSKPMSIILLGDMEFKQPAHIELAPILDAGIELFWIVGNHDTDRPESLANLLESEIANRCIDGRVVTLKDGTRIAGLGGVFREKIWYPNKLDPTTGKPTEPQHQSYEAWARTLPPASRAGKPEIAAKQRLTHRSSIFPDVYWHLAEQRADILVTHEAPTPHPHGFVALTELAQLMGVRQCFHGHQHDALPYAPHYEAIGFELHGVGLRGITGRSGQVIVPGELDEKRGSYRRPQS
jgi:predicted phosphodiesterase